MCVGLNEIEDPAHLLYATDTARCFSGAIHIEFIDLFPPKYSVIVSPLGDLL